MGSDDDDGSAGPAPGTAPGRGGALRGGYSADDIDGLARVAARWAWGAWLDAGSHLDWRTRLDLAWEAIAERLYAAPEPPCPADLVYAGRRAIAAAAGARQRHHGYDRATGGDRERFAVYWDGQRHPQGPEDRVVDWLALQQIWPHLSVAQQRAFHAIAEFGTQAAAAAHLGITESTLKNHVIAGRRAFFGLWHEHETPTRVWAADRRVYRDGIPSAATYRKAARTIRGRGPRKPEPPRVPRHGTASEYGYWGCRCPECRAYKAAQSQRRLRKAGPPRRFITDAEVAEAVSRKAAGEPWAVIAGDLGCSVSTLQKRRRAMALGTGR